MAFLNQIQIGRWDNLLRRLLNMKEQKVAPSVATDVSPAIIIENDRPEWGFLTGEVHAIGEHTFTAGVGNFSQIMLHNNGLTGMIVVVHGIMVVTSTDRREVVLAISQNHDAASGPAGNIRKLDNRFESTLGGSTTPTAIIRQLDSNLVQGTTYGRIKVPLQFVQVTFPRPVILWEQNVLNVVNTTANEVLSVTFFWSERPVEPGERGNL